MPIDAEKNSATKSVVFSQKIIVKVESVQPLAPHKLLMSLKGPNCALRGLRFAMVFAATGNPLGSRGLLGPRPQFLLGGAEVAELIDGDAGRFE